MLPIEPAESRISSLINPQSTQNPIRESQKDVKFSDTLSEFVSDVNSLQVESGKKLDAFIKGEPVDIHDVMISAEKAKTSFELLMELRNKALELYKEVNRMQV